MMGTDMDVAVLGGGLAGALVALALRARRPELRLCVVEKGPVFGGNHLWSFFPSDIAPEHGWLIDPLVVAQWGAYEVAFPARGRQLGSGYRSIESARLDAVLRERLPPEALLCGADVVQVRPDGFTLADGRSFRAGAVIDARGLAAFPHLQGGWQTFLGQSLRLERAHGQARPMVMDMRVEQFDALRFMYALPFAEDEIFLEDTYYTTDPAIDRALLGGRIAAYARARGWQAGEVLREETGCLPVVAGGDFAAFWAAGEAGVARIGVRAGLFHPLTGYSLPVAVETALMIAALPDLSANALHAACTQRAHAHWRAGAYYRMLARMLFAAPAPQQRWRVFAHFYRLDEALIERFYGGRMRWRD
ncbi:MAG TPA: lycopene beta-cyclase CrtY, partial [Novosphingobium sp.]|nr:lycopene beta-cyclase CrtY [Novosphingobium sp.]